MQRTTLTSRFLAGFTPGHLPPRGPDGMIPAGPPPLLGAGLGHLPVIDPPTLCEAGPCRNYHRVVSVMDAQDPVGGTGPARRQITRACYPTPGIDLELGEIPVLQCSRWEPESAGSRDEARRVYLKTKNGQQYLAEVATFEDAAGFHDDESEVLP